MNHYTAWVGQLPPEFWLSAVFGSIMTLLYAANEFPQPTFQPQPDKPETNFAPAELTSFYEYTISFSMYLAGLLLFYWLVCLIGPAPFVGIGLPNADKLQVPGAFPLWVAAVLVGVMPRLPVVSYFEQSWRKLMHTRAQIPHGVRVRAADFNRSEFSFQNFETDVRRGQGPFARNVTLADIAAPSASAAHRWARLSALLQQLSTIDAYPAAARYVDADFIDRHRAILSATTADYFSLAEKIKQHRGIPDTTQTATRFGIVGDVETADAGAPAPATDAAGMIALEYTEEIETLLRQVCMFLACAMLTAPETVRDPDAAMRAFGFHPTPATDVANEIEVMTLAIVIALIVYCAFVFVAFHLGGFLPDWMVKSGWPSADGGNDRLLWIATFVLPQVVSIGGALVLRNSFRGKHVWFRYKPHQRMPSVQKYVGLFLISFVLALVTSSYLAGTWQGAGKIFADLHWRFFEGFVPATSALFVCLAIDADIIEWNAAKRALIAVLHVVLATLIAFAAAEHFYTNDKGLSFLGAVLYSTIGTCVYAASLAVTVLILTWRTILLKELDGFSPQADGAAKSPATVPEVQKVAAAV